MKKSELRTIMSEAWQFVKIAGISISEALKKAWAVYKLKRAMLTGIVKFYFQKVDGSIREAYGTLAEKYLPATTGEDNRKKNNTVQVYFDTEVQAYRCFKKMNLV